MGQGATEGLEGTGPGPGLSAFVGTNVLIRLLTGDPPRMAARARELIAAADELLLADLVVAETVYVLESFYECPRAEVAELMRAIITAAPIVVADVGLLLRSIEVYEVDRLDFAEAYLVANAEASGIGTIASFDRSIDRVATVRRVERVATQP